MGIDLHGNKADTEPGIYFRRGNERWGELVRHLCRLFPEEKILREINPWETQYDDGCYCFKVDEADAQRLGGKIDEALQSGRVKALPNNKYDKLEDIKDMENCLRELATFLKHCRGFMLF